MSRALVGLAVMGAMLGSAHAQSSDFTREFQAGTDAYRLGDYAAARSHLTRAREIDPGLPGPHRFLAAVEAAEGNWQQCVDDARRAIVANPASSELAATRKLHDDCRAGLGLPSFTGDYADGGAIAVSANVGGALIRIGGLKLGSTPLAPRPSPLGEVEITASKAGWTTATATAIVVPGVVTDVTLVLIAEPPTLAVDAGPARPEIGWVVIEAPADAVVSFDGGPPVAVSTRVELPPGEHTLVVERAGAIRARRTVRVSRGQLARVTVALVSSATATRRRTTGTVALGAAAGLGAVGVVTGLLAMRASDQARDWAAIEAARPPGVPLDDTTAAAPLHTRADIAARGDRADTLAIVSGVGYAASAVALGLGVYLRVRWPDHGGLRVAPMIGDSWGLAVSGGLP